jgi:hypothetical protein
VIAAPLNVTTPDARTMLAPIAALRTIRNILLPFPAGLLLPDIITAT